MFSHAVGREERCKQISLACVGSARSVWATLGLPPLMACVLSQSTLLRLPVALQGHCLKWALGCVYFPGLSGSGSRSQVLHKGADAVGPASCALPRSEQLRRPGAWRAHCPRWSVRLITSPVPAAQFPGCVARAPSQVCCVCPLRPSWRMSTVQDPRKTCLATGSLLAVWWRMPSLGPRLSLTFQLWLSPTCLSASRSWGGAGLQMASSPLVLA